MSLAVQALNVGLPVVWLVAAVLHGMGFAGPEAPRFARIRRAVTGLALLLHLAVFLLHWSSSGASSVFDPWTTLSAVAFFLALLFLGTSLSIVESGVGGVVLLVVALLQLIASAFGPMEARPPAESAGPLTFAHAITSVAAASALLLSALHGGLLLLVLRRMKRRKFGRIVRALPNLRVLARLTRRAALAGFLLLFAGINFGLGAAFHADVVGFHLSDPWVLTMLVLWVHFGVVAFSRLVPGFTAQRTSLAAGIGGCGLLAASLLAVLPDYSFHWRF